VPALKCIILLSEKSSGSSACQNLLSKFSNISTVRRTRHFENETLYWTKAASILEMPQLDMLDSEVPIPRDQARSDLIRLLTDNLDNYAAPQDDHELIFDGWKRLCQQFGPIFLEKSPHHLCQWSSIELMLEAKALLPDVEFLFIGLVRNPMDTLYSQFARWRARPEHLQQQWAAAYRNLLRLKQLLGDELVIVRYEDMVSSLNSLQPVLAFCNSSVDDADKSYLHKKSLSKWRKDRLYGFMLSHDAQLVAEQFGYDGESVLNTRNRFWPVWREAARAAYYAAQPLRKAIKSLLAR